MRRAPAARLISVRVFRNGWRRWSSSLRKVSTSNRRPRAVRDSAAAKSWVERSAQCMSSSSSRTGPAAAASRTTAVRSSNTWNASRLRGASGSSRVSIRRADGRDPRSSTPAEQGPHRLDHRGERHTGLEVETVPRRHGEPQLARAAFEVRDQRGLPDPGVAPDEHDLRGPLRREPERLVQLRDVPLAPQQQRCPARYRHAVHRPRRGGSEDSRDQPS